jgi:hypothetical protein
MAQRQFRSDDTSLWGVGRGDGSDGALAVSSSQQYAGEYKSGSGSHSVAGTTINLSGAAFTSKNNKPILIIQMSGAAVVGWEYNAIKSGAGTSTLTLAYPLTYAFNDDGANERFQVIEIKQYTTVTFSGGFSLYPPAWDGDVGGVFPLFANGEISGTGKIDLKERGFKQTSITLSGNTNRQGDGTGGPGTHSNSANGNGGGGGEAEHGAQVWGGGGGGGNGAAGSNGVAHNGGNVGVGGLEKGSTDLSSFAMGGQGGVYQGSYGIGSGGVIINCYDYDGAAIEIDTDGGNSAAVAFGSSSGGGGAGGSVSISAVIVALGAAEIHAAAGTADAGGFGTPGGAGAVGRIAVNWTLSLSGSTTPTYTSRQDFSLLPGSGAVFFL